MPERLRTTIVLLTKLPSHEKLPIFLPKSFRPERSTYIRFDQPPQLPWQGLGDEVNQPSSILGNRCANQTKRVKMLRVLRFQYVGYGTAAAALCLILLRTTFCDVTVLRLAAWDTVLVLYIPQLSNFVPLRNGFYSFRAQTA